jgi:hypothetical protein
MISLFNGFQTYQSLTQFGNIVACVLLLHFSGYSWP